MSAMRVEGTEPSNSPIGMAMRTLHELAGVVVIIPAWQPEPRLVTLVTALMQHGVEQLVLVDDGSASQQASIFGQLAEVQGVALCRHTSNRGKGRALKTAFEYVLATMPMAKAVVTADADGQHLPGDIVRVAQESHRQPERAVLGVRSFTGSVPLRSRWGNALMRKLFAWLTGYRLRDTQTGLRGVPMSLLPELMALPGERYEYETVMLAHLCRTRGMPTQVGIETVYLNENRGSHFHPLRDSLQVYLSLLRVGLHGWGRGRNAAGGDKKPQLRPA